MIYTVQGPLNFTVDFDMSALCSSPSLSRSEECEKHCENVVLNETMQDKARFFLKKITKRCIFY